MYFYFAQFHPDEENPEIYNVFFPDLPGCATFGIGLNDAMAQAMDALTSYIEAELDAGEALPQPSDLENVKERAQAENNELAIPDHPGTLYLLVPAEPAPEPCVETTVCLRPAVLALIDRKAAERGMTRDNYIEAAVIAMPGAKDD